MVDRVVLHVGLMKSGTTFLQGRLGANRETLASQGVLFPAPPWSRQVQAVKELSGNPDAPQGAWDAIAEELRAHAGTGVMSMEFLGPIAQERLRRLPEDFPEARVEAVVTVRDLGRTVPAMWQEAMQNRRSWSWQEYVEAVRTGTGDAGKAFWRQQGADRIIRTWASVLGKDAVTVITVPPKGAPSGALWDRFCEVLGVEQVEWADAPRANESLGLASALMMGRLNERVAGAERATYNKRVKSLAKKVLPARQAREDSIGFAVPPWLVERSERRDQGIAAAGVRILGDLHELQPLDIAGGDPTSPATEQQLEAALDLLAALVQMPTPNDRQAKGKREGRQPGRQQGRAQQN